MLDTNISFTVTADESLQTELQSAVQVELDRRGLNGSNDDLRAVQTQLEEIDSALIAT